MRRVSKWLLLTALFLSAESCGRGDFTSEAAADERDWRARAKEAGALLWGADVVGGVPYVYEDPKQPGTYLGFEKDIADAIGRKLNVEVRLVVKAWDTLVPELQRGSFDMAMNGIEDTEDRGRIVLFSDPYYVYTQQLTVRKDTDSIHSLEDLEGKAVATLSGTAAEDILRAAPRIRVVTNPEIIYSYKDLEEGKVDAVLLDTPIAAAYGGANPKLKNVGEPFGTGRYVIAFRREDTELRDAVNDALRALKQEGELQRIYAKWGIMNRHQAQIGIE